MNDQAAGTLGHDGEPFRHLGDGPALTPTLFGCVPVVGESGKRPRDITPIRPSAVKHLGEASRAVKHDDETQRDSAQRTHVVSEPQTPPELLSSPTRDNMIHRRRRHGQDRRAPASPRRGGEAQEGQRQQEAPHASPSEQSAQRRPGRVTLVNSQSSDRVTKQRAATVVITLDLPHSKTTSLSA